jgi:hypothetical protein
VRFGDGRDLRKMRDRENLRALREALECRRDGMGGDAADAGVDLVEDERLASRDGRERERNPRELPTRRGISDGREREAGIRPDEEGRLVRARRPGVSLA